MCYIKRFLRRGRGSSVLDTVIFLVKCSLLHFLKMFAWSIDWPSGWLTDLTIFVAVWSALKVNWKKKIFCYKCFCYFFFACKKDLFKINFKIHVTQLLDVYKLFTTLGLYKKNYNKLKHTFKHSHLFWWAQNNFMKNVVAITILI